MIKNEYQEALDYLRWIGGDGYYKKQREKSLDVLQELVDKETPMKPTYRDIGNWKNVSDCQKCGKTSLIKRNYCGNCGQRIDRSEEE